MADHATTELILIRHGPTTRPGVLCGRTDVALAEVPTLPKGSSFASVSRIVTSPAKRARQTAQGLWPDRVHAEDARLWEQDFGAWDGKAYADLPDLGAQSREALALYKGHGGESFHDVVARLRPVLGASNFSQEKLPPRDDAVGAIPDNRVAIVAHAGVIRAALAIATGNTPAALAFEIDHLSVTRLRLIGEDAFSVISVNEVLR